jgi:hypothetical protein
MALTPEKSASLENAAPGAAIIQIVTDSSKQNW